MAFTIQNASGTINDANAYISTVFFTDYHKDRGNALPAGTGTGDKQKAIIAATDYLDQRFTFEGEQQNVDQRTQWPRISAIDRNGKLRSGLPHEVTEACADYALLALTQALNPTPDRDSTGRAVEAKAERVGPISESTAYSAGASFQLPKYPVADQKLRASGLVVSGKIIRRA